MIILVSGASCTGKTLLSQRLLEKYRIPYLSIDHIKMGLYRGNYDCGFSPADNNNIISEKIWPLIKGIIMTNIENKQNLIIEGCYIMPEQVKELGNEYLQKIIPVFICFSDNYINKNFESNIIKFRNEIEIRKYEENRDKNDFIKENNVFRNKAYKNGLKIFEIEENYIDNIEKIYSYIESEKNIIEKIDKRVSYNSQVSATISPSPYGT